MSNLVLAPTNRITFTNYEVDGNEKIQEVSFDMGENDNITKIVSEFRMFLLGQGYFETTVDEFVPYYDVVKGF